MFEYIRWFYFDPTAAMAELQNQDRPAGELRGYSVTRTNPNQYDIQYFPGVDQPYTVDAAHMYLPYPEIELIGDPDLASEPVHFPYN